MYFHSPNWSVASGTILIWAHPTLYLFTKSFTFSHHGPYWIAIIVLENNHTIFPKSFFYFYFIDCRWLYLHGPCIGENLWTGRNQRTLMTRQVVKLKRRNENLICDNLIHSFPISVNSNLPIFGKTWLDFTACYNYFKYKTWYNSVLKQFHGFELSIHTAFCL